MRFDYFIVTKHWVSFEFLFSWHWWLQCIFFLSAGTKHLLLYSNLYFNRVMLCLSCRTIILSGCQWFERSNMNDKFSLGYTNQLFDNYEDIRSIFSRKYETMNVKKINSGLWRRIRQKEVDSHDNIINGVPFSPLNVSVMQASCFHTSVKPKYLCVFKIYAERREGFGAIFFLLSFAVQKKIA